MRVVLVTGATGFIGRQLIRRLLIDGYRVRALVHTSVLFQQPARLGEEAWPRSVEAVGGDVRDACAMKSAAAGVDTIFHLAGKADAVSARLAEAADHEAVNVDGTRNVMEGAVSGGVPRVVFVSSVKVFGEGTTEAVDETVAPRPSTAYGRSKLAAEELLFDYGRRCHLHVACLRLPMVYGHGQKGNLSRMIAAIDRGIFPPPPANHVNRRSLVHVSHVVESAMLAATHSRAGGQRYIVTDARPYSTRELYEDICRCLNKTVPRWSVPLAVLKGCARVGDALSMLSGWRAAFDTEALQKLVGSAWYSSAKVQRELGFHPSITFREALPELIQWYRGALV